MNECTIRDELDLAILTTIKENPGIRLVHLSQKLNRGIMTIKYRLTILERTGEVKIERGNRLLKIYPCQLKEAC